MFEVPLIREQSSNKFAVWLLLIGIFVPASMIVWVGDTKFTPGRIAICLLLFPAIGMMFQRERSLRACDGFALGAAFWMMTATLVTGRYGSLSSTMAVVLEFFGGYVVARAYIFGPSALRIFVHAMKIIAVVIIVFAALEHLAGDYVVTNAVAAIWGEDAFEADYRQGLLRARSVFPHPILYGTFCAIAGTIFMYSERNIVSRAFYVGVCAFGCVSAMSSAPLISFSFALAIFCYDLVLRQYGWRWKVLVSAICGALLVVSLVANKPTSWIIANLTLDPSTGYFRQATWDRALYNIGLSPWTGYGFDEFGDPDEFFDGASIDSVWLVLALRFGVPVVTFIILASITSTMRSKQEARLPVVDPYMENMRTAFSLVLMIFFLAGLTVHYWLSIWVFWGVCIGIRGSLQEYFASDRLRSIYLQSLPSGRAALAAIRRH